jgi:MinD-like ATPase involved in chromosome partitioning or flagellar assembly
MYTVTFYSFKGGTGRSMALANVAAELAKRGKRVLIVDFDLEAPGLDTFRLGDDNKSRHRGIVDYIVEYGRTGEPPEINDFVYQATPEWQGEGCLWIMPAGKQSDGYDEHFRSIDWQDLYENHDGFLLFENLKAQWRECLKPDYVLIDSRTGHTDTGGICTRQLPEAVVVFFFPNEQNRRGLEGIVNKINAEADGPLGKSIDLHFVMANVPDLDDEEEILAENLQKIQETLKFSKPTAVIHHYNSLSLLNQAIFTVERPRSRLAQEYRELTSAIVGKNLEDEQGAVEFLDEYLRQLRNRTVHDSSKIEQQLEEIRAKHANRGEILRRLARVRGRQAKNKEALALLKAAMKTGLVDADILIGQAQLNVAIGDREAARSSISHLIDMADIASFDLAVAIRLLREVAPDQAAQMLSSAPALRLVPFDLPLVRELETSLDTLPICEKLLRRWIVQVNNARLLKGLQTELALCLIGQGRFGEAKEELTRGLINPNDLGMTDAFNLAMVEWALKGAIPREYVERVMALHGERPPFNDINYLQCISLCAWALGDPSTAMIYLSKAGVRVFAGAGTSFSSWSYLVVPPERFMQEIDEMRALFRGENVEPIFIRRWQPERSNSELSRPV